MNALVKKEIRLLLPSWAMAMLLALPAVCTRSDDEIPVFLLFFGMAVMALTSIGRETSLNTFSQMLAQPAERMRIWQTKLMVLLTAFLSVFVVWRLATIFSFHDYGSSPADADETEALLAAGCLAATATFSGGLWATLLLRQVAGAFWLTLLVPATLAGFTAAFLVGSQPGSGVITAMCIIIGVYSIGGFVFARWLFFRAQDIGWTGGIIALPQLNFLNSRSESVGSRRKLRPFSALLKKEFQLQQVSLMGAAGLLVLHIGVLVLRANHQFPRNSAGEALTAIFWMFWLVLPVIVGAMSIAEERRLGTIESQLCLPASRRMQFAVKGFLTLFLGVFLGGLMPCLLEAIGVNSSVWRHQSDFAVMLVVIMGLSVWLTLVSFFASSLAKNFLQAVGFAIAAFMFSTLVFPALTNGRMIIFDSIPLHSFLSLFIAIPTLLITLLWLTYWNFKNFRDGWHALRRSLLVFVGAVVFVILTSTAIYNRAWECFEPAEPAHGPAKLFLANPPNLKIVDSRNVLVRLPDGRVWFDYLNGSFYESYDGYPTWRFVKRMLLAPLPESYGPQRFMAGSNWVEATTERVYFGRVGTVPGKFAYSGDYLDTVGIKADGTLWVSDLSGEDKWNGDTMHQFGDETNWRQLAQSGVGVILLKNDGTLWRWGAISNAWQNDWLHDWPGLRTFTPQQIGTYSDWQNIFTWNRNVYIRQTNGNMWFLERDWKSVEDKLHSETNFDEVVPKTTSRASELGTAFVQTNGTLWVLNRYWDEKERRMKGTGILQVGKENDWQAVAVSWDMMVGLKTDGSLWQWYYRNESPVKIVNAMPSRLGIHNDWVAVSSTWDCVLALAGDGSLWLWPDKQSDEPMLLQLPKQPKFLGNVLTEAKQPSP